MRIVSVNVGLPKEVIWKGAPVKTGIFKEPVDGPVPIKKMNLAGDRQADLSVHGGLEKAVYAYPAEHYEYWREVLPDVSLSWGKFGENLTTEGLKEHSVCIGDYVKIGSAVLMVTQPRMPCYKLNIRFNRDDMIRLFLTSRRSGFYFSVVEEGEVRAGTDVKLVHQDPQRVTVVDILELYLEKSPNPALLQRVMNVDALPQGWKTELLMELHVKRP